MDELILAFRCMDAGEQWNNSGEAKDYTDPCDYCLVKDNCAKAKPLFMLRFDDLNYSFKIFHFFELYAGIGEEFTGYEVI